PHKIDLYTETTPFLKDVIILSNQNSEPILIRDFNEAAEDKNGLWKTIDFNISGPNETTLIISGTADQNQALRIGLNNKNYGWSGEQSIDGNELNGTPKTVVINEFLEDGPQQLKIFNDGPAKLYSVAIYGSSKLTDVKDISKNELDNKNIIIKANPNPFNNSTIINYITKQNSNNRVRIFNTLGQQIEILVDEFQNAGEYNLSWNPKDQTSGIYICILESDNYFKVEKLLLLK
ncbi:MAG: T9SS type A sorting domain-containing protein, partial [Melioribacteraceae bacterium]|nr:T9SS type A sorting domain-containing protein [Melioribacteraceae bacterium]